MEDKTELRFVVKDKVLDEDLSLDNVSLPILSEFANQVMSFIKGSENIDISEIKTSIKNGSIAIAADNNTGFLDKVIKDYEMARTIGLDETIDPKRALVIQQWQVSSKKNENRTYELSVFDKVKNLIINTLTINKDSNLILNKTTWVDVEDYAYGVVYDMGGKSKPNVHIELDNGRTIKIGSEASLLARDDENRLYQKQLVRFSAQKNVVTKELRNEKLIQFEYYSPSFDEDSFNEIVEKGTRAWSSVVSPTRWVESLRGNE